MNRRLVVGFAVLVSAALLAAPVVSQRPHAQTESAPAHPGVELAQTLSLITGVAISPLLGVAVVGAWKYLHAETPAQKAALPWFAQPWFWVPALLLVALVFVKDVVGTAAPTALKKPFDVAEAIENKISGLVATGAFVPVAAAIFTSHDDAGAGLLSASGLAAADLSWLYNVVMVPVAMAVFFIVWLAAHAINVLILISPFTTVDTALKSFRLFVLSTVPVTSWINPWLGALWALILIAICYCLAGWSFRMTVFGTVFVWDIATFRCHRFRPNPTANWMFLARKLDRVPVRTYGRLVRDSQGRLALMYRPWLVFPPRTLPLPEGQYEAGRGLLYSEILRVEGEESKSVLMLPPRYRGHEAELVHIYGLAGLRDIGLRRAWRWLKELFGFKSKPQPATA